MNRAEHLFSILAEECSEVAQRASKVNRFGVREVQPGQVLDNSDRLICEWADLQAVMEMLQAEGFVRITDLTYMKASKKAKVEKFLKYSEEQGTLQ